MKRWIWILLVLYAIYIAILFWPAVTKKWKEQTAKTVVAQWLDPVRQVLVQEYLFSYQEPWAGWILSMIAQESGGHADAYNPKDPSWGLMGITQGVLADYNRANGKTYSVDDLKVPFKNLEVGIWYWHFLLNSYASDYEKAVMAYNAGQGNIEAGRPHLQNVEEYRSLIQPQLA